MVFHKIPLSLALLLVVASAETPATADATTQETLAEQPAPPAPLAEDEQSKQTEALLEEASEPVAADDVGGEQALLEESDEAEDG